MVVKMSVTTTASRAMSRERGATGEGEGDRRERRLCDVDEQRD